jgi:hypothetical protein
MVRLPQEQKIYLEEQAELNLTSQNAEIIRAIRFRMTQERPERAAD